MQLLLITALWQFDSRKDRISVEKLLVPGNQVSYRTKTSQCPPPCSPVRTMSFRRVDWSWSLSPNFVCIYYGEYLPTHLTMW